MCPYFNRDPTPWQATKSLLHPFLGRRHRTLSHHLSVAIGHIIVARLVSQIHADRKRFLPRFAPCLPPCLLPLRTLWTSVILLHGRFSFCTLSASIPWELTASRWGPAFSFHLGYIPQKAPHLCRAPDAVRRCSSIQPEKVRRRRSAFHFFFAGHGVFDDVFKQGYIVARDSRKDDR